MNSITIYISLLVTKFFKVVGSFSLKLDFQKDKSCPYLRQPYREGFQRPKRSLWPHGAMKKTFCVSTSMLYKPSTHACLQWEINILFTVLTVAPFCSLKKWSKMKFCSDAGTTVATFLKSFTPAPKVPQLDWSKQCLLRQPFYSEKSRCFKFQNSFLCSLKESHSFLFCFPGEKM